jgi:pyruvoyl-dependent arginine decarboxylase (PvlArgDC)
LPNDWIGVDLDGTLAHQEEGDDWDLSIGAPVERMVQRVKKWLSEGEDVRIFTARVHSDKDGRIAAAIRAWCKKNIGVEIPVTNKKDPWIRELWDDKAVQVKHNTGEPVVRRVNALTRRK